MNKLLAICMPNEKSHHTRDSGYVLVSYWHRDIINRAGCCVYILTFRARADYMQLWLPLYGGWVTLEEIFWVAFTNSSIVFSNIHLWLGVWGVCHAVSICLPDESQTYLFKTLHALITFFEHPNFSKMLYISRIFWLFVNGRSLKD